MSASIRTTFHFPPDPEPQSQLQPNAHPQSHLEPHPQSQLQSQPNAQPNAQLERQPHVEVPFHRLARANSRYRWWRPVLELLIVALVTMALMLIFIGIEGVMTGGASLEVDEMDLTSPLELLFALVVLAVMIPACWAGARFGSRRPWGFLWSVMGRVRWDLFRAALGPVAVIYTGYFLITLGVSFLDSGYHALALQPQAFSMLLVIIAWVPAQSFAEELVFRGLIPQFFGAYVRSPWVGYGIGAIVFTAGHAYDWVGLLDIFAFAVCAAVLVHKSGGLELSMVLHAVNNLMSFGLGIFVINDVNATEIPLADAVVDILLTIAITVLLLRSRRVQECLRPPLGRTTAVVNRAGVHDGCSEQGWGARRL